MNDLWGIFDQTQQEEKGYDDFIEFENYLSDEQIKVVREA